MTGNRATVIANAPTKSTLSMISTETRHVVCMGTETSIGNPSTQDKMFIRWSDQETVNTWTPSATNTAGSQRLTAGNKINAVVRSRGAILIFTDTSLYQMQFIGAPFTFGFKQLGSNCGAVGINAAVDIGGISYWMGDDNFYLFDGRVKNLPCTVRRYIFDDLGTEIGFISSMTNPFCGSCTRARLSSDGKLYNCLFASKGMDIKSWIRSEMDDNTIEEKIVSIWKSRDDRYSELRYLNQNNKEKEKVEMYYIGG